MELVGTGIDVHRSVDVSEQIRRRCPDVQVIGHEA